MARETKAAQKERFEKITAELHEAYPDATCSLGWSNPLELLVATILSAQTTDAHVNEVTPGLFKKYKTAKAYASVPLEELQEDIRSIGLFRNKSKFIQGACQALVDEHRGQVPQTMEELIELPGVARKTANVVLGTAFGVAEGIAVDTHVHRLSKRLGAVKQSERYADKVEKALLALLPRDEWTFCGHAIILHGREVCHARKPVCSQCCIAALCPKKGVKDGQ